MEKQEIIKIGWKSHNNGYIHESNDYFMYIDQNEVRIQNEMYENIFLGQIYNISDLKIIMKYLDIDYVTDGHIQVGDSLSEYILNILKSSTSDKIKTIMIHEYYINLLRKKTKHIKENVIPEILKTIDYL